MTNRVLTNGTPLDARFTNYAREARSAGLDPVLFGFTDIGEDPRTLPANDKRLSTYEGVLPGLREVCGMRFMEKESAWIDHLRRKGHAVPSTDMDGLSFGISLHGKSAEGTAYEDGGAHPLPLWLPEADHCTQFLVDQTMDYIQTHADEFVVHLSLIRPHPPFVAPEPYNTMYPPSVLEDKLPFARAASREEEAGRHALMPYLLSVFGGAAMNESAVRGKQASYFGLITEVDLHLGRLFAMLKDQGLWDSTLIVLTSDHGEMM